MLSHEDYEEIIKAKRAGNKISKTLQEKIISTLKEGGTLNIPPDLICCEFGNDQSGKWYSRVEYDFCTTCGGTIVDDSYCSN